MGMPGRALVCRPKGQPKAVPTPAAGSKKGKCATQPQTAPDGHASRQPILRKIRASAATLPPSQWKSYTSPVFSQSGPFQPPRPRSSKGPAAHKEPKPDKGASDRTFHWSARQPHRQSRLEKLARCAPSLEECLQKKGHCANAAPGPAANPAFSQVTERGVRREVLCGRTHRDFVSARQRQGALTVIS